MNIAQLLHERARMAGHEPAIVHREHVLTFAELDRVLTELDRLADRLDRFLGQPAGAVLVVVLDERDAFLKLGVHAAERNVFAGTFRRSCRW